MSRRRDDRRRSQLVQFLFVCILPFAIVGCSAIRRIAVDSLRGEMMNAAAGPGASARAITAAELDELTRASADRYVGLLSSTCDALKKGNADAVQRRERRS